MSGGRMRMWGDDKPSGGVREGEETLASLDPNAVATAPTPVGCHFSGGVCLTRERLKRAVHETHEALTMPQGGRAITVAERAYHRALYELANHHCETSVGDGLADRETIAPLPPGVEGLAPTDIADIEKLIDRVCELYARRGMADIAEEYRDARLVLRTRILMLMAERPPRRLVDILEELER